MNNRLTRRALAAAAASLLALLCGCGGQGSEASAPAEEQQDIVILYTNDVHGGVSGGIGYAGLAALKSELAADGTAVTLVDAGDAIQGEIICSVNTGENIIELMNAVPYDLAIPGNHEFDYGVERLLELAGQADYPYLSCNLNDPATGELLLEPYRVVDYGAVQVGFVGVTTPQTVADILPEKLQDADGNTIADFMRDRDGTLLYTAVQEAVDAARADGADYVILLGHLGIDSASSPWTSSEVITHTTGIDALIDGHSHTNMPCEEVRNADGEAVLLTQTGTKLANVGLLRIAADGTLTGELLDTAPGSDAAVAELIDSMTAEYEAEMSAVVAASEWELVINQPDTDPPVRIVRRAETNLGDLVADGLRTVSGADVAFMNGGSVRATIGAGDITLANLYSVMPFGNDVYVVEVTGQQLLDALEMGARCVPEEEGSFLQVSGLTYEIDVSVPSAVVLDPDTGAFVSVDGPYRVGNVTVGGEPLDPDAAYTLCAPDFLLSGGSTMKMIAGLPACGEFRMGDVATVQAYLTDILGGTVGEEYADPFGSGRIVAVGE